MQLKYTSQVESKCVIVVLVMEYFGSIQAIRVSKRNAVLPL